LEYSLSQTCTNYYRGSMSTRVTENGRVSPYSADHGHGP